MIGKRGAIRWISPIAFILMMALQEGAAAKQLQLECGSAIPLQIDEELSGDTTGLASQIDSYGCGDEPETGPEQIYRLELSNPTRVDITIESDVDLDLILLDDCDAQLSCLALGDTGIRSLYPVTGEFYVVVDGYAGAEGAYTLRVTELTEPRIPQDFCPTTRLKRMAEARSWWGSTCTGTNLISALLCSSAPTAGQESRAELFEVEAGGQLRASLSSSNADLAIYLIGGCEESSQCLQSADLNFAGGDEVLDWTNHSDQSQVVSLVVDTVGVESDCAEFHISVEGDLIAIPAGENSWSTLKSWFANPGGQE